jgi:hypothetical protein
MFISVKKKTTCLLFIMYFSSWIPFQIQMEFYVVYRSWEFHRVQCFLKLWQHVVVQTVTSVSEDSSDFSPGDEESLFHWNTGNDLCDQCLSTQKVRLNLDRFNNTTCILQIHVVLLNLSRFNLTTTLITQHAYSKFMLCY